MRRKIDRYELTRTIDSSHFFPPLEAAVDAFQKETGAEWVPAPRNEKLRLVAAKGNTLISGSGPRGTVSPSSGQSCIEGS